MAQYSKQNQKHNNKNLNSAICTPLRVKKKKKWVKLKETELLNLLTSPAFLG
jgi:hypothetical protein